MTSDPGIQQFWLGQSVVFGCLDCHEAAHTREGIDHGDDCSVHNDDGLRADGWGDYATCPNCGEDPLNVMGSGESLVGECGNENCSVLQYEANRSVDTDNKQ